MPETLRLFEPYWRPHPGQRAFLERQDRITVLACGRRWGKTDACAAKLVLALMGQSPTKHLLIAPTQDQSQILFERVLQMLDGIGAPKPKVTHTPYPKLTLGEHRLQARSGHLGHALRGHGATHIVVDEAAYVHESIISEVAMPMLATTQGSLTLISTPRGHNHFWRFFGMGQREENGVWSAQAPSRDNPAVSPQFLAIQKELLPDRSYRTEYEAEFVDTAGAVFPTELVEACTTPRLPDFVESPVVIGIDFARYSDYTAVAVLDGHRRETSLQRLERWTGVPWREQIERAARIIRSFGQARVVCDATGVGDPVVEMLRAVVPEVHIEGFVFGSSSKSTLLDQLVMLFEQRALKMLPHVDLLRELQHFQAQRSPSGHTRLAAAQGYHDDLVMALALACHGLPSPYQPHVALGAARRFCKPQSNTPS